MKQNCLKTTWETPESCPYCGEHLSMVWSFCPECGRPTDWSKNEPLTIDELLEMDGEPVYVKCLFDKDMSCYTIVGGTKAGIYTKYFFADFDYYNQEWIAFRRKPNCGGNT